MSENKLPSRFQIGDKVVVHGNPGVVHAVIFTEPKVNYTVVHDGDLVGTHDSDEVHPEGYVAPGEGTEDNPMLGEQVDEPTPRT